MKLNFTYSTNVFSFSSLITMLLFAISPFSAVAQCPNSYVSNLAAKTITFQFEAGNGAADQDVACDFVRAHGGAGKGHRR